MLESQVKFEQNQIVFFFPALIFFPAVIVVFVLILMNSTSSRFQRVRGHSNTLAAPKTPHLRT